MENDFTVTITTGNEAMRTNLDLAEALERVAERLRGGAWQGKIRDVNGNTVGQFS